MKKQKISKAPPSLENRKARFRFEILETCEAGIVLVGTEVKSLRLGQANISDAYLMVRNHEAFLINLHIQPYVNAGAFNHQEDRTRKVLLRAEQIRRFQSYIDQKRLSIIPLKLYFNSQGRVKIILGLGKGKKQVDKRQDEKKHQAKRDIERALREVHYNS